MLVPAATIMFTVVFFPRWNIHCCVFPFRLQTVCSPDFQLPVICVVPSTMMGALHSWPMSTALMYILKKN